MAEENEGADKTEKPTSKKLTDARKDGNVVEKRRFEARVPVSAIEPGPAGIAINQAANQVAAEVADWVGR